MRIARRAVELRRRAELPHQHERVDMAFVEPADRQVAAADMRQRAQQRAEARRLAEPGAAERGRQRRGEQAGVVQPADRRGGIAAVVIGLGGGGGEPRHQRVGGVDGPLRGFGVGMGCGHADEESGPVGGGGRR